jgi:hypothetical protein
MGFSCGFDPCPVCGYEPESRLVMFGGEVDERLYGYAHREAARCLSCRHLVSALVSWTHPPLPRALREAADLNDLNRCPLCCGFDIVVIDFSATVEKQYVVKCPRCETGYLEENGCVNWE